MRAVIFDIDGTLANIDHRRHYVEGESDAYGNLHVKKNWKAFFAEIPNDTPNEPIVWLNDIIWHSFDVVVILCTGRSERLREVTEKWLKDHNVKWDVLMMRPDDDFRADCDVKRDMLDQIREQGHEPFLVIDDRKSVVDMWRSEGVMCLQCAEGDY